MSNDIAKTNEKSIVTDVNASQSEPIIDSTPNTNDSKESLNVATQNVEKKNDDNKEEELPEVFLQNSTTTQTTNDNNKPNNDNNDNKNEIENETTSKLITTSPELFINNIAFTTTTAQLKEHFSLAANLIDVKIFTDPHDPTKSRGYGVAKYATVEDAQKALDMLNASMVDGRSLVLKGNATVSMDNASASNVANRMVQKQQPPPQTYNNSPVRHREAKLAHNHRPGDWYCPVCGGHQYASRTHCRSCGAPNPLTPPNASYGRNGRNSNYQPYQQSNQYSQYGSGYGAPPSSNHGYSSGYGSSSRSSFMKPGDWSCPSCGDHQFSRNDFCRKCNAPKPIGSQAHFVGKPGDWNCPNCGDHQFSRNVSCRVCGAPRPESASIISNQFNALRNEIRPGDWYCSMCNEHQYASRTHCRKCGAAKGNSKSVDEGQSNWNQQQPPPQQQQHQQQQQRPYYNSNQQYSNSYQPYQSR